MRKRLRPTLTADQLAVLYQTPHQHGRWPDHRVRVNETIGLARFMYRGGEVADLSCGDAAIAQAVHPNPILGDLAPGYPVHGPIEQTIHQVPRVGLFLCCETLEHLDDPDAVLRLIRGKCDRLVISTPCGETDPDENPEHYWGWDQQAVGDILQESGFIPVVKVLLDVLDPAATYQLWGCR